MPASQANIVDGFQPAISWLSPENDRRQVFPFQSGGMEQYVVGTQLRPRGSQAERFLSLEVAF